MNRLSLTVCGALLIVSCTQADSVSPRVRPLSKDFSAQLALTSTVPGAPNVEAARAAEAAALREIEQHLGPESRDHIMAALTGGIPGMVVVEGKTPAWQKRYQAFYAARAFRAKEQRRQRSIETARARGGIPVVVALARPAAGTIAAVFRRRVTDPFDVIVIDPSAPSLTLGAAFALLDQSREALGDDLEGDITIGLRDARVNTIDPKYQKRLEQLMDRLRKASDRSIDGIGVARAIELRSGALRKASL